MASLVFFAPNQISQGFVLNRCVIKRIIALLVATLKNNREQYRSILLQFYRYNQRILEGYVSEFV